MPHRLDAGSCVGGNPALLNRQKQLVCRNRFPTISDRNKNDRVTSGPFGPHYPPIRIVRRLYQRSLIADMIAAGVVNEIGDVGSGDCSLSSPQTVEVFKKLSGSGFSPVLPVKPKITVFRFLLVIIWATSLSCISEASWPHLCQVLRQLPFSLSGTS